MTPSFRFAPFTGVRELPRRSSSRARSDLVTCIDTKRTPVVRRSVRLDEASNAQVPLLPSYERTHASTTSLRSPRAFRTSLPATKERRTCAVGRALRRVSSTASEKNLLRWDGLGTSDDALSWRIARRRSHHASWRTCTCGWTRLVGGRDAQEGTMERFFKRLEKPEKKRVRPCDGEPETMVTWNCNGLSTRLRQPRDVAAFEQLLKDVDPDAVLLQEVKLAASGPPGAKRGDGQPRNRQNLKRDDASSAEDCRLVKQWLKSEAMAPYDAYFSLADWKYAGTCLLLKKKFHADVRYSLRRNAPPEQEGRVVVAEFPTFVLLNTYVPNNGWTEETFHRRRKWDATMMEFLQGLDKPLVWMGDLNVAHTDADVSHPELFRTAVSEKDVPRPLEEDRGQPGFTPAEQARFSALLRHGSLVDAYRKLHPTPTPEGYTWRGSPPSYARFYGKGMRIDYALVSERLFPRVRSVRIVGRGAERHGFMGSDHCPVVLVLQKNEEASDDGATKKRSVPLDECDGRSVS